jgi:hypothetical protein
MQTLPAAFVLLLPSLVFAEAVEWKVSAQAGLILTTGNSRSTALSGSITASRKAGNNKLGLETAAAYARSRVLIASDADGNGTIGPAEIQRTSLTSAENWSAKLRYDRFFTEHNSAYLSARIGADQPAGKELFGGGQIGYSRQIVKTERHEVVGEGGYDFTYEAYVADSAEDLAIHSARIYAGWTAKVTETTGFLLNAELLLNLNAEDGPRGEIPPLEDARVLAKAALTTKIFTRVDFRFALTARFDNAPAPQPPFAIPYDADFLPLAEKLDLTAEAALIINIL